MKERMAADESLVYWVDNEDMSEWNFESIKEDNTFYVNENEPIPLREELLLLIIAVFWKKAVISDIQ